MIVTKLLAVSTEHVCPEPFSSLRVATMAGSRVMVGVNSHVLIYQVIRWYHMYILYK